MLTNLSPILLQKSRPTSIMNYSNLPSIRDHSSTKSIKSRAFAYTCKCDQLCKRGLIADPNSTSLESCLSIWHYFETWSEYTPNMPLFFGVI